MNAEPFCSAYESLSCVPRTKGSDCGNGFAKGSTNLSVKRSENSGPSPKSQMNVNSEAGSIEQKERSNFEHAI